MRRGGSRTRQKDVTVAGITLSPRQMDVLEMMASGMSAKKIAERLGIATAQAKQHRNVIRKKFGLSAQENGRNNVERIVARAKQLGFLT